jgi:hypothetical protein
MIYDLFYISDKQVDKSSWEKFKEKFPTAKLLENVTEFEQIKNKSFTKFFWVVWDDIVVDPTFLFDYRVSKWDEEYIHVFRNGKYFDGVVIFSKSNSVSKKEFTHRFFTNKKEVDIMASEPKPYDKFYITSYDEYLHAIETATTSIFWSIWNDVLIEEEFLFNYQVPKWDEECIQVFRNGEHFDGIVLFNKNNIVSKKEFKYRFFTNKKEVDILASRPKPYDKFYISTYGEYLKATVNSTTDLFWVIWPEIEVVNDDIFSLHLSKNSVHDLNENHVFKHIFRKEETYVNGLVLFSRNKVISEKEFNFRFLIEKKEHDVVVSKLKLYDIVFISYNEANADLNYEKLLEKYPQAYRVHGVKGIHQAHIEAARKVSTEMFWVIDADAIIEEDFNFDYEVSRYDLDVVHVWRSRNPINDLVYGHGGVKLLPRNLTINMDISKPDMTTSISSKFNAVNEVSNITAFNTDEFSTWKSAFRECVKLSSRIISGQKDDETQQRLEIWKTVGADKLYGKYAIRGAIDGEAYGTKYKDDIESLKRINDFNWLREYYEQRTKNIHT